MQIKFLGSKEEPNSVQPNKNGSGTNKCLIMVGKGRKKGTETKKSKTLRTREINWKINHLKLGRQTAIEAVPFKPTGNLETQVQRLEQVKHSKIATNVNCLRESKILDDYVQHQTVFFKILSKLDTMWDGHVWPVKAKQYKIKLSFPDWRPIHDALLQAGPKALQFDEH